VCSERASVQPDRVLICGAGNLLLSDEGFGVHFVRYLEQKYVFPPGVELLDAGTLGILVTHRIEEARCVYLIDCIESQGDPPGTFRRFDKEDFLLKRLPIKLSPHQAGLQEMLLLAQLRGRCPEQVHLLGVIPESLAPGVELTGTLHRLLEPLALGLVNELRADGRVVETRP
jgi:hydrogenase maturation protease